MTTIACWFNHEIPERPSAWMAGDGKLSQGRGVSLLSNAAKIMQLTATFCTWGRFSNDEYAHLPGETLLFSNREGEHFTSESQVAQLQLGFAYAGSSLVALNTHAALSFLFSKFHVEDLPSNLPPWAVAQVRLTPAGVPALEVLAQHAAGVLEEVAIQVGTATGAVASELAISGHCPVDNELQIFHIVAGTRQGRFSVQVTRYTASTCAPDWVLLMGAAKEQMQRDIDTLRTQVSMDLQDRASRIRWNRLPLAAVLRAVELPPDTSIGGAAQLGVTTQAGFTPYQLLAESAGGHPTYLGYNTNKLPGVTLHRLPVLARTMHIEQQVSDTRLLPR